MTREEIEELKGLAASMGLYDDKNPCKRAMILGKAIKALEQEPCEDAISREDALMCLTGEIKETDTIETIIARFVKRIRKLPPVIPQQKTGHWIDDKCSVCGKGIENLIDSREWYRNEQPNFCPFCGLKLVNSQESEE